VAGFGAFLQLADEVVDDLDRSGRRLEADSIAHRIVGTKKSIASVEQMRRLALGPSQRRGNSKRAGLGLAIRNERRFRHVAGTGRIAHDVNSRL
jgi:hypothetical protein